MDEQKSQTKTYHITTFGCQMNVSDSERVAAIAENLGYKLSDSLEKADLIVINSCSIRQKAEDRVMGMGKKISQLKSQNPDLQVILTGCMAKREERNASDEKKTESDEKYEQILKNYMPWLDHIVQIKNMHKLADKMGIAENIKVEEYLSIKPKTSRSFIQWIPISTGCNKFCTFCIVPFSRGSEIYRPYNEIIKEIQNSIQNGAKEITLLGQNVNSWRGEKNATKYIESKDPHRLLKENMPENMMDFADLLDEIGTELDKYINETGNKIWIKFTSSHPYDIDEKLVDVILKHDSIAKQFHFAMQSGSNSVLKRMNRHYTVEDFIEKCELIRKKIPMVGISTDIIVGFCGETEQEFKETCDAMKKLKFDQTFISEYSTRKGTVADRVYKDNVSNEDKSSRKVVLNDILSAGNHERNEALIGKNLEVLIYRKTKNGFIGRTESGKDVILPLESDVKSGQFIPVNIIGQKNWSLIGEMQN